MVEAYSHQMSSAGFWPDRAEESVFYAYAYRSRTGSATIPWPRLMRSTATSSTSSCWPMTRFAPPRTPTRVLPEFLQTTYEGAAELGRWIGGRSRTTQRSARDRDEATAMTTGLAALPDDVLDRIACASVVEAMGQLHSHRAHILSLVSPAPRRLFGPVATIAYLPYRDDLPQTQAWVRRPVPSGDRRIAGGYGAGALQRRLPRCLPRRRDEAFSPPAHRGRGRVGGWEAARLRAARRVLRLRPGVGAKPRAGAEIRSCPSPPTSPWRSAASALVPGDYVYADASGAVVIPRGSLHRVIDEPCASRRRTRSRSRKSPPSNPRGHRTNEDHRAR
jgi:hypothetical protein